MHRCNTAPNTISVEASAVYGESFTSLPLLGFSDGIALYLFAVLFAPHGLAVADGGNGEINIRDHDDSLLLGVLEEIDCLFELLCLSETFDYRGNGHDASEDGLCGR